MEITTGDGDKYLDCPATASAKTVAGKYTLVMGHLINCSVWLDYGFGNDNGEFTRAANTVQLVQQLDQQMSGRWAATLADVGSNTGDSDGKFFNFLPLGCGGPDITCADVPTTGPGPVTVDFGIVQA